MFEINLLPWRNQKRQQEIHRQRLSLLAGFSVGIFFWMLLHVCLEQYNRKIIQTVASLGVQLNNIENQVLHIKQLKHQNDQLINREKFMTETLAQQEAIVNKLKKILLVTTLPLKFFEIDCSKKSIRVVGQISSITTLALLMNELKQVADFQHIKIKYMYRVSKAGDFRFQVVAQ